MLRALDGGVDGLFVMGQNPAVGVDPRRAAAARAGRRCDWLVVRDLDRARDRALLARLAGDPLGRAAHRGHRDRGVPDAGRGHVEKAGHFTNTQRLLQWRDKAIDPPGDARSELHFMVHLGRRLKAHYAELRARARLADPQSLTWDYSVEGPQEEPDPEEVLREISGYEVADRPAGRRLPRPEGRRQHRVRLLDLLGLLRRRRQPDAPARPGRPRGARRLGVAELGLGVAGEPADPLQPRLGRSRGPAVVGAQALSSGGTRRKGDWAGYDVAGLPARDCGPTTGRTRTRPGMDAIAGDAPFIMMPDGRAHLYSAERPARRAAADPLRAARVAGAQRALPGRRREPGRLDVVAARRTRWPSTRTRAGRTSPRRSG